MVITEARRRRRSLYLLVLDGEEGPEVDKKTFDESPHRVGEEITPEAMEALLSLSCYNRARDRALYLLSVKDYCRHGLFLRLKEQAPPEVARAVVDRLTELSLLDDEAYAARLAASLSRTKRYPRRRILMELQQRGIAPELAREAVENLEPEDFQQALALLRKKYYNKMRDPDDRRRVSAALARRGFSFEAVRRAMEAWDEGQNDEE